MNYERNENVISQIIQVIGVLTIVGGIVFFIFSYSATESLMTSFNASLIFLISGIFVLGLAEIIKLLDQMKRILLKSSSSKIEDTVSKIQSKNFVDAFTKRQIDDYFRTTNKEIRNIIPSPFEYYYLIETGSGYVLLDNSGIKAKEAELSNNPELLDWYKEKTKSLA